MSMTREKALETIAVVLQHTETDCDYAYDNADGSVDLLSGQDIADALRLALAALREQAERRWIPVTERLPEEHKSVFPGLGTVSKAVLVSWVDPFSKNAYPDNSFVREGITRNGEFTLNHINSDLVPVAWMPTPEPYKPPKEV